MNHAQLQTLLAAYSQLNESERRLVDAHVLHCADCAAQLRAYQQMDRRLGRLVDDQISYATRHVISPALARQPAFVTAKRRTRLAWLDNLLEQLHHPSLSNWQLAGVAAMTVVLAGFLITLTGLQLRGVVTTIDTLLDKAEQTQPTPISSTDKVTITFACHHSSCEWFKAQAQAFHQQHPNIEVQIKEKDKFISLGADGRPKEPDYQEVAAMVDSGEWWHALYGSPAPMPRTERGGVRNLRQFIQTDPTFPAADFFPAAQQYVSSEFVGGIPVNIIPPLVVFDKTLFDAAGIAYPSLDWQLADLYGMAHQITSKKPGKDGYVGFADGAELASYPGQGSLLVVGDLVSFLQQRQGATPAQIMQALAEAIQRYRDLIDFGATQQAELRIDIDSATSLPRVSNQTLAMWTELFAGESTAEYRYPSSRYGFAALPQEMRSGFPLFLGNVYYISAQSQHPQESWRWLRFLADQVNPHDVAPPARRSSAESQYFNRRGWDVGQVAALRAALQQPGVNVEDNSMAFSAIRGTINTVIESVLKGQSVAEAMERMRPRLENEIATWQAEQLIQETFPTVEAFVTTAATMGTPTPLATTLTVASPTPPANDLTLISFACHETWACAMYENLAREFERQHPHIAIDTVYTEMPLNTDRVEFFRQTTAQVDTGIWFDPVEEVGPWTKPVNEELARMLTNLAPLMANDSSFDVTDFYPVARAYLERKGDTAWSLPIQIMPMVIAYNRQAFRKNDVPYPASDWTLADFYATARQVTRYEGGQREWFGFVDRRQIGLSNGHHLFLLDQLDPLLQAQTTVTGTATFPRALVDAIRRYTDLALKEGAMPNPTTLFEDEALAKFAHKASGAAMWTALLGHDTLNSVSSIGIAPLPQPLDRRYPLWLGSSVYISKQSRHPQESWLWLKFLSEHDLQTNDIPARRSTAERHYWSTPFVDEETAAILRPLVEQPIVSEPYPEVLIAPLNTAIDKIFAGTSVETALADAQPAINLGLGTWRKQQQTVNPTSTPIAVIVMVPTRTPNISTLSVPRPTAIPDCSDSNIAILEPAAEAVISGVVSVVGTANREGFQFYKLEYAGDDPEVSFTYFAEGTTPVLEIGQLGMLDTTALANGDYHLRLTVVDKNGNFLAQCRVPVTVKN